MSLTPGTRLGPYEIGAPIGAGGMGEVYRATDSNLKRSVAIKVLPASMASDADRLARFQREAEVLAALNHPNIAAIYGLEKTPGLTALVMELVEGEDLSEVIARYGRSAPAAAGPSESASRGTAARESLQPVSPGVGPRRLQGGGAPRAMNIDDALPIARQIADALEAAHEQGIVHRDLKPANIKVRADGTVKVLDFGLAKATDPSTSSSSNLVNSPTMTSPAMTAMGMILGTAAYMSPEQAKGRAVDKRADIWAFGVVLCEMLTGQRLFEAEDVSETLAAVLTRDVSQPTLPANVPPRLRRLLRDCLVRDPKQRLRDIGEARRTIDQIIAGAPDEVAPAGVSAVASSRRDRRPWIVAGLATLIAGVALTAMWWPRAATPAPQTVRFTVPTESPLSTFTTLDVPRISPDGRLLAFLSPSDTGERVIWIRPIDAPTARPLSGTAAAGGLFWSPDSRSIGYSAGGKVFRIGADGSGLQTLCDLPRFAGASWGRSGTILLNDSDRRLFEVSEQGGAPVPLTTAAPEGVAQNYLYPSLLPDGRHFIYLGYSIRNEDRAVFVGSLDGGAPVQLIRNESAAAYVDPGFLLFVRAGALFAQRFDPSARMLAGEPVRIADDVMTNRLIGRAAFSASDTGTLVYRSSGGTSNLSDLVWVDRTGKVTGTLGDSREYYQIRLSPDGRRAAITAGDITKPLLSILDVASGVASAETGQVRVNDQAWGADSQTLAYEAEVDTKLQFLRLRVGTQKPEPLFTSGDSPKYLDDWSADGKFLLFHAGVRLFVAPVDASSQPRMLLQADGVDNAHFSPDGKWIAYQVSELNTTQVWIASFPAFDERRRISPAGGAQPVWSRDGRELFYLTRAGKLMSVKVDRASAGAVEFKTPVELFQSPLIVPTAAIDQYAVTNDNQRFLFIRPRATEAKLPINVVVNWAAELKK